jgi:hypothetical protein
VETVHGVLIALAERYSFGDVAALVAAGADGLTSAETARVRKLCVFGQRLLDLDAEDFGEADPDAVSADLRQRSLLCRMPQAPDERNRGALGSLRPAYALLLEVIEARWRRQETSALVAAVHIASEYAPLLAWEQVLGHAGDPLRLPDQVSGRDSVWGDYDNRDCPHTKAEKSAAQRVLRVAHEPPSGWRAYLDRQHSNTSHALGVCAAACPRPCSVFARWDAEQRALLTRGSKLAQALNDSAVVKLRHAAPVGRAFGVPARGEVLEAWQRSRSALAKYAHQTADDDGFPLPGLPALFSALAGVPIRPSTLLRDTSIALIAALRG